MTKKGFTLIELLAVILILGIISLIAIPTVNNIINEAKRGSFKATVQNVAKAAETKCQLERLKGEEQTATYTFSNEGVSPSLDMKGKLPTSGTITVDNECNTSFSNLTDGKYVATKTATSNNLVITEVDEESPKLCQATTGDGTHIGDVITCGTESFYVYDTTGDNIKMLSKYNLKVGGVYDSGYISYIESEMTYMQDANMRGIVSGETISYGGTAFSNTSTVYTGSIAEGYVDRYAEILTDMGVTLQQARLITKSEIEQLVNNGNSLSEGNIKQKADALNRSWIYSTSYWTDSTDGIGIWCVSTSASLAGEYSDSFGYFGVRPVIVISKNEI